MLTVGSVSTSNDGKNPRMISRKALTNVKEVVTPDSGVLANKSLADFYDIPECDIFQRADLFWAYSCLVKRQGHYNYRRISTTGSGPTMIVIDRNTGLARLMICLASNDYLNLTKHPKVIAAGIQAIQKYGSGAGSVPLLSGTLDIHIELEAKIAEFKGCEDAITYTSGFGSNFSTIFSLLGKNDVAVLDTLVHASIVDGCANTNRKRFSHNDPASLEKVLKKYKDQFRTKLVIIDGVYSMDGDIAKLDEIIWVSKKHRAYVMVDEAHATGVIGLSGKGTPEHFNVEGQVDIVAGTFSKGLGCVGGFIAGGKELIELLRFFSRGYMFSTAMTPQSTASLIAALDVIQNEPHLLQSLWHNIRHFRERLLSYGFNIGRSETAIFPIIIGDDYKVKEAVKLLHEQGIYANPVLYPAVRKSQSRIRMSLMSSHTIDHLDAAFEALKIVDKKIGICGS